MKSISIFFLLIYWSVIIFAPVISKENDFFNDKFILINYLYSREDKLSDFEKKIKDFFDNRIIKNKKLTGIILQNQGNQQLLILKNNNWFLSEPEDYIDLKEEISKKIIPIKNYNVVIGINNIEQLKEIYNCISSKKGHNLNFNRLNVKNEKIINPSRW